MGAYIAILVILFSGQSLSDLPAAPEWKSGTVKRTGDKILLDPNVSLTQIIEKDYRTNGHGTGFFISRSGHLLTNHHVIDGCDYITAQPTTGGIEEARIIALDAINDLALLQVQMVPSKFSIFRKPGTVKRGEVVRVVGYGVKTLTPPNPQVTLATILSEIGQIEWTSILSVIWPGNSGGPIFDSKGLVVGVTVAKADAPDKYKLTGEGVTNVAYMVNLQATSRLLKGAGVELTQANGPLTYANESQLIEPIAKISCWKEKSKSNQNN